MSALAGLGDRLLDAGQRRLGALADGEDAELGPLLVASGSRPPSAGRCSRQDRVAIRMSGSSVMPAGSKRMLVNASTKLRSGTPYCRPWLTEMAKASMMPASVEPCFDTLRKISPGSAVVVLAHGDVALAVGDAELERARRAVAGQLLAHRHLDDFSTTFSTISDRRHAATGPRPARRSAVSVPSSPSTAAGRPCSCRGRWRSP